MKLKEVIRQVPWLGVSVILLLGVAASAMIIIMRLPETDRTLHTIRYFDSDGTLLEEQTVQHGDFAIPPKLDSTADGIVFDGWNRMLYGIGSSADVEAVYRDMRQGKNVFYIDAAYGELGEKVESQIWISGQVCLSGIQLKLVFDSEVLRSFSCDTDGSPFEIVAQDKNSITLQMSEEENYTNGFLVANISYKISGSASNIAKTKIRLEMKNPVLIRDGSECGTDSNAVHGIVYILN